MREIKTWLFYYILEDGRKKIIVEQKDCKAPERTKVWKQLNKYLHNPNLDYVVSSVGYELLK